MTMRIKKAKTNEIPRIPENIYFDRKKSSLKDEI